MPDFEEFKKFDTFDQFENFDQFEKSEGFDSVDPPELPPDPNEGDFSIGGDVSFGSKLEVSDDVSFGSKLEVSDDVSFGSNLIILKSVGIGTTNPSGTLQVGSGSSIFIINENGSVGIGTINTGTCGTLEVAGTICATEVNALSDENLKYDIKKVENPIHLLNNINGVQFKWKSNNKSSIGVIAQEVDKVFPQLISSGEVKSVNYNGLIGVLIEAVKTQQIEINELHTRIKKLENN